MRRHPLRSFLIFFIPLMGFLFARPISHSMEARGTAGSIRHILSIYGTDRDLPFRHPSGVFFDERNDELLVADIDGGRVQIFNKDGIGLYSFGNLQGLSRPYDIVVDGKGRILILERDGKVFSYDFRGEERRPFHLRGFRRDERQYQRFKALLERTGDRSGSNLEDFRTGVTPRRIAIDDKDNIYAVGTAQVVLVFDDRGEFQRRIGRAMEGRNPDKAGDGELVFPIDVFIGRKGKVYVLDNAAGCISVFSRGGDFLFKAGRRGGGRGELAFPVSLAADSKGRIYVADATRHTIVVYGARGDYLFEFGGLGKGDGWFFFPSHIFIDARDRIYVADTNNNRVQIFQIE